MQAAIWIMMHAGNTSPDLGLLRSPEGNYMAMLLPLTDDDLQDGGLAKLLLHGKGHCWELRKFNRQVLSGSLQPSAGRWLWLTTPASG